MALHGEIRINGESIGTWTAVRKEEHPDFEGRHRYQCEVSQRNDRVPISRGQWRERFDIWRFDVWHDYSDGAIVLAGRVLSGKDTVDNVEHIETVL